MQLLAWRLNRLLREKDEGSESKCIPVLWAGHPAPERDDPREGKALGSGMPRPQEEDVYCGFKEKLKTKTCCRCRVIKLSCLCMW